MRRLIVGLLVCVGAWGQSTGQNVVEIAMNSSNSTGFTSAAYTQTITTQTTFTSNVLQNIGQTSHTVQVQVTTATVDYAVTGGVQGSLDGSNWFFIGPSINTNSVNFLANQTEVDISGFQSYPYVRTTVTVSPVSNASLVVRITYVGNSSPSHNLVDMRGTDVNMNNFGFAAAVPGTPQPLTPGFSGVSVSLYSMSISIPSTVTALTIGCSEDGGVSIGTQVVAIVNAFTTSQELIWPSVVRPYITCGSGTRLWMQVTGTGNMSVVGTYRYE